MEIRQINHAERTGELAALIRYARGCSWQGTGSYFADCLEDSEFDGDEKIVAAYDGEKIIGFAALVKESCIEEADYSPWLDFLFVDERYRNKGIAKAMVEFLLCAALANNTEKVYLCTVSHKEMYEIFGFAILYSTKINGLDECYVMSKQISIP